MNEDLKIWLEYTKDLEPLSSATKKSYPIIPAKLVHRKKNKQLIDARLDLHGFTQEQAFAELKNFLAYCHQQDKKNILIITGKGRLNQPGVIKLMLPRWLEFTELKQYITSYSTAKYELGGEGAILVVLK